ncbi:MAG: hypothetical protein DI564_14955 [Rhodanobacter denitrificans]|uniref:Uncharacterized protein n=1 Tax=Rhodanobacter denitrificans TaxID=666685 RepID=A0A2W5K1F6_9GAMM|nr:MAG: hypothetical protein DI564_14955 [Rhodanobacter denitrificans]
MTYLRHKTKLLSKLLRLLALLLDPSLSFPPLLLGQFRFARRVVSLDPFGEGRASAVLYG